MNYMVYDGRSIACVVHNAKHYMVERYSISELRDEATICSLFPIHPQLASHVPMSLPQSTDHTRLL